MHFFIKVAGNVPAPLSNLEGQLPSLPSGPMPTYYKKYDSRTPDLQVSLHGQRALFNILTGAAIVPVGQQNFPADTCDRSHNPHTFQQLKFFRGMLFYGKISIAAGLLARYFNLMATCKSSMGRNFDRDASRD